MRCVVHYQVPASVDIYVHRSGRTARGDADGLAIALVAPKEAPRYAALQQVRGTAPCRSQRGCRACCIGLKLSRCQLALRNKSAYPGLTLCDRISMCKF